MGKICLLPPAGSGRMPVGYRAWLLQNRSNMKSLLPFFLLISIVISCNSQKKTDSDESDQATKNVTKRDYSITPAVAYNDLFLDSTAVEQFITEKKWPDSLAKRS